MGELRRPQSRLPSSTSITAAAPAHAAGTVNVVVTNPDGQSATLANGYIYSAAEPNIGLSVPYGDPNSATVAAGQTATYTLSIGGQGMSGTASLSCTGVPASAGCSVPATLAFNATTPTTFTAKVTTTARVSAALPRPALGPGLSYAGIVAVDALAGHVVCTRNRFAQALPSPLATVSVAGPAGAVAADHFLRRRWRHGQFAAAAATIRHPSRELQRDCARQCQLQDRNHVPDIERAVRGQEWNWL